MTESGTSSLDAGHRAVLERGSVSQIPGWREDNHAEALAAFAGSCTQMLQTLSAGATRRAWGDLCKAAAEAPQGDDTAARLVLENCCDAWRIVPGIDTQGFLTGYFEPEVDGALEPSKRFPVPLYRQPGDLIVFTDNDPRRPPGFTPSAARQGAGGLVPYQTRQEIENGALAGRGLEIAYVRDKITAFFIHVQGSARIRLPDGTAMRVGFAAKNGHPYTSIGRYVSETYAIAAEALTADRLRAWLASHPEQADGVMWQNRSFIFFRRIEMANGRLGPQGALGVALTPQRSLAVDRTLHMLGAPVWIDAMLPGADGNVAPFRRLMIAQDTGSAIVGVARGDIFFGTGAAAGHQAGLVRHAGQFVLIWPKDAPLPSWAKAKPA